MKEKKEIIKEAAAGSGRSDQEVIKDLITGKIEKLSIELDNIAALVNVLSAGFCNEEAFSCMNNLDVSNGLSAISKQIVDLEAELSTISADIKEI